MTDDELVEAVAKMVDRVNAALTDLKQRVEAIEEHIGITRE
jgi:hypothetical protein